MGKAIVVSLNGTGNFSNFSLKDFELSGFNIQKTENQATVFCIIPPKLDDLATAESVVNLLFQATFPVLQEKLLSVSQPCN